MAVMAVWFSCAKKTGVADWCLLLTFRLWGRVAIRLLKRCIAICFQVFLVGIITIKAR